ncbi:MAG TPA: hypothetical protein VM925_23250, partial [Labilithrix sp.]|nr:hypothetical protein [Labilithrix sp.]
MRGSCCSVAGPAGLAGPAARAAGAAAGGAAATAGAFFPRSEATPAAEMFHDRQRQELGNNDPTVVGHVNDLVKARAAGADDHGPTSEGDRQTVVGASP